MILVISCVILIIACIIVDTNPNFMFPVYYINICLVAVVISDSESELLSISLAWRSGMNGSNLVISLGLVIPQSVAPNGQQGPPYSIYLTTILILNGTSANSKGCFHLD